MSHINSQSGRSMIEMLGVLAIVGILSAGAVSGYSMAMESYKANTLVDRIQNIVIKAQTTYGGDYKDLNSKQKNKHPFEAKDLHNPFGDDFYVRKGGYGDDYFVIHAYQTPADACIKILQTNWLNDHGNVTVHKKKGDNKGTDYKLPLTVEQAVNACKGGDKQLDLTFKWK